MTKQTPAEPRPDAPNPGQEILYGAQTRLALANFGISGLRFPRAMIQALGLIKACAARVNGFDLLTQLSLLTGAARALEEQAITRLEANVEALAERAGRNAMLVTALTPRIGYDLAGRIARTAIEQGRSVIDVARELSGLPEAELVDLLDAMRMARPHNQPGWAS